MASVEFTSLLKRFFPDLKPEEVSAKNVKELLFELDKMNAQTLEMHRHTDGQLLVFVNKYPSKSRMVLVLFTTVILISRRNSNFLKLKIMSTILQFNG